jgi:PAS domain S-box-containing protein
MTAARTHQRSASPRKARPTPEPEAHASEARLRAIINTVVDGIITIDEHGVMESVNPAAERIFGYKARELVGHNVAKLMPAPFSQQHDAIIQRYLRTGKAHIIGIGREVVGQRKDGQLFPLDLAVSEWRQGKPVACSRACCATSRSASGPRRPSPRSAKPSAAGSAATCTTGWASNSPAWRCWPRPCKAS